LIAVININNPVYGGFLSGHLGYSIDGAYANKGFMSEGLALVLDYAFNELGFHRMEANIQPGNIPSKQLVKKLGFKLEGFSPKYLKIDNVWCDHERWAIISEEWNQSDQNR
jgi:ribosomal-protein-alanine N-acetyltransferase